MYNISLVDVESQPEAQMGLTAQTEISYDEQLDSSNDQVIVAARNYCQPPRGLAAVDVGDTRCGSNHGSAIDEVWGIVNSGLASEYLLAGP